MLLRALAQGDIARHRDEIGALADQQGLAAQRIGQHVAGAVDHLDSSAQLAALLEYRRIARSTLSRSRDEMNRAGSWCRFPRPSIHSAFVSGRVQAQDHAVG